MISVARRGLRALAALAGGGALIAAGLTGSASASRAATGATDPTVTIRVGGIRTAENGPPGPPTASGLAGVTYRASAAGFTPVTCTSTVAGTCTLNVTSNKTYTITQTGVPAGWYANPDLVAGSGGSNTPRAYDTLSVAVGTGNVTIPVAAPNSDTSPTARSGTWAESLGDPALPAACGLRIALLIDLSSSITSKLLPTYKAAARAFVESLKGTPSSIALYTFGTTSPAPSTSGSNNANLTPPVSTATQAGVDTLVSKINGLTVPPSSGTNWDTGLWRIVQDNPAYHYQSAFVLTDGDPTFYGPTGNGGRGNMTRFAEIENAVFSANALKNQGTKVISVGIGGQLRDLPYVQNIRAISGPVADQDYYNTDFLLLSHTLTQLALQNCAGLDVTKTAAPPTYDHVGQEVTYTYHVTNPKYFTLRDVRVLDDHVGHTIGCTPSTLATGASATCTATYAVTQADLDAGHVTNAARATGQTPNSDTVTSDQAHATVTAVQKPAVHLAKSAAPASYGAPGQTINYTYTVTNTGNVTLHDVALHDTKLGAITCPYTEIAPGTSMTCSGAHATTQADVDHGLIANTADVTANPPTGPPVTGSDHTVVHAIRTPAIHLDKEASPTEYSAPGGETIAYTYTVTNTGNVTLHRITLHDDRLGAITCPLTELAPAATMACTATYVTTQQDVDRGHIVNSATVTGHPRTGHPVTDTDGASVHAIQQPGIQLDKSASPPAFGAAGETLNYTYTVTNVGNVSLRDVALDDSRLGPVTCPETSLAPAQAMTCTGQYVTTQADVDKGDVENAAVVTGLSPNRDRVTGADTTAVPALHSPGIAVAKSAFPVTYGAAGEQETYTYTVTNTGNDTLHSVTLTDDKLGVVTCLTTTLAPGASTTCLAYYRTTQADVDAGQVTNVAVVTGDPPSGPPVTAGDTDTVTADHAPSIAVSKQPFPTQYGSAGEVITYFYTVVNTGNVTLHDVTLDDNRLGHVSCDETVLAPGQSMTCLALKDTTAADLAAGHFTNVATVTGDSPAGARVTGADTATIYAIRHPGLQVRKTVSPDSYDKAGTAIAYTYTVVNTGDVALHGVTLADSRLGRVSCPVSALATGESATCQAVYVTTAADVTAGHVLNIATAAGRSPGGTQVTGKAEAIAWAVPPPFVPVTG
jgi:von Willebrand factor type A domain